MGVIALPKRSAIWKPGLPCQIDYGSPLARGLAVCCPMNEAGGSRVTNLANPINGSTNDGTYLASWEARSRRGNTLGWASAAASGRVNFGDSSKFLPTQGCTIVMGYRKRDATSRTAGAFDVQPDASVSYCGAYLPFSDGTVYWDFGGFAAGATRLSVAGLTFGDDVWAFSTGARGMEIWQNGILRASNAANPSRTGTSNSFFLGAHAGASNDVADYTFFYLYNLQLPQAAIEQLAVEPFAVLTQPRRRFYMVPGSALIRRTGILTGGRLGKTGILTGSMN